MNNIVLALVVFVSGIAHAGALNIRVVDEKGGLLPCRMLLRASDGVCVVPEGSVVLTVAQDKWFMSDGTGSIELAPGRFELRVERGLEYVRAKRTIQVSDDVRDETVELKRWINMKQLGYLSGENHLHVPAAKLGPMLAAEGLDFGTSLQ